MHRPYDRRRINAQEKAFIESLVFSPIKTDKSKEALYQKKYREKNRESENEKAKLRYQKKSEQQKNDNLNYRFIAADPNKVLSISDICYNPYSTNYSDREEFKVNLWKELKTPEEKEFYTEKWYEQREAYEKEVAALSVEYKTEFLKQNADKDYSEEWEKRNKKYLDHFCEK